MEELITLFANNGTAIACLIYFMWYNSTVLKEFTMKIEDMNHTLIKLIEKVGNVHEEQ